MTGILNTRILASLAMILFVGAVVASSTGAFFSDTETSTGNTFTAGELDLTIDNTSYGFDWNNPTVQAPTGVWGPNAANSWALSDLTNQLFFSFRDLKPGDYGEDTISMHVQNNAWACMAMDLTATPDNGINDPETDAGDITDGDGGELQNYLSFMFWNDDGDNVLETGEQVITELSGLPGTIFGGAWHAIADQGDTPLQAGATTYIGKGWCFGTMTAAPVAQDGVNTNPPSAPARVGFTCDGSGEHNVAQTDGISVDVSFYSVQSRNNANFQCSSLPPFVGEGRPVGAVLADYVAPTCNATVSGTESIQTELGTALAGQTVCVDSTYDRTGDNVAIRMETSGVTLAALTQGILLDVPVVLSADDVTVTGFEGTIGQAESASEIAAFYFDNDATNASLTFSEVNGGVGAAVLTETGADNSGGLIQNNVFSGVTQGIYLNPHTGSIMIRFNDFENNAVGIAGFNGALVVANEFRHTTPGTEAIGIDGSFDSNGGSITNNNFLNGMFINAYDATVFGNIDNTVDAEDNFFSTSGAAQTNDPIIDFTPEAGAQFPHN